MNKLNTPTGASTNPKNLDLNKNISTSTSDIALICIKQILVLEVQPHLLCLIPPCFGPLLHFFLGPLGLFVESGSGSKSFLEPTYVVNQLWFWKYSPIFLLILRPTLGPFLPFLGL